MAFSTAADVAPDAPDRDTNAASLAELRELIVGPELREVERLRRRLDDPDIRSEELSQTIAEAIALRAKRDRAMLRTLQPMVEEALRISVERDPKIIADSLYPIIGQAVRKAVAASLRGMVESLNHVLERSFSYESFKWRLEALRTGRSFGEIALMRSLRFRVEQVFLVHRETGLLLGHVAASNAVVQDTDLVSAMLTAVQDFVRDSFSAGKQEELDTMQVGEYTVWVQHGPHAILAAMISGAAPPDMRGYLQRVLEKIHADFAAQLQSFSGDASTLSGVLPLLRSCLLGSQATKAKRSYRMAFALLTVLALLLVGLGAYKIRQAYRWNLYTARLRSEPGVMLTSAERHWTKYVIVGLRDPLAVDPDELVQQYGIDPVKVESRWEPYSSLDPVFSTARSLLNGKAVIEGQVIRFGLNSPKLEPPELVKIDAIQSELVALQRQATDEAHKVTLQVIGHTDRTGQETANKLLSQKRAEAVVNALLERGIPASMITAAGVGASRPAQFQSDTYLEDLNRRVTFRVSLPPLGRSR
jgi:outer membrane protein OmpA-like peptidoglycan-associated protein